MAAVMPTTSANAVSWLDRASKAQQGLAEEIANDAISTATWDAPRNRRM